MLPHIKGQLLDLGCGDNQLVRIYGSGVGVDVHLWNGVDVLVGDSSNLPFRNNSFDTISIVAALNHIPNREDALRESFRILKDNGQVVVTMIPPLISRVWHWFRRASDSDQRERGMKAGEVFGLSRAEVLALLKAAGLLVIVERRFMLGLNYLAVAAKRPGRVPHDDIEQTGCPDLVQRQSCRVR